MIRFAICDDEKSFRKQLCEILEAEEEKAGRYIYEYDSLESLEYARSFRLFDVYFMDIELGGTINGVEYAKKIRREEPNAIILFTTSHEEYALEGYDAQRFKVHLRRNNSIKTSISNCPRPRPSKY